MEDYFDHADQDSNQKLIGRWKPFFKLIRSTKIPYGLVIFYIIFTLSFSYLTNLFPDFMTKISSIKQGDDLGRLIILMVVVLVGQAVLSGLIQLVGDICKARVTLSFRRSVLGKMLKLPLSYFEKTGAESLISRETEDTVLVSSFISTTLPGFPSNIYDCVAPLIILLGYDYRLVLLACAILPLSYLLAFLSGRLGFKWTYRTQSRLASLTGYLADSVRNVPLTKQLGKEEEETIRGEHVINRLFRTKVKKEGINYALDLVVSSQDVLQAIICVIGGVVLIAAGYITVGQWMAFFLYCPLVVQALSSFIDFWREAKQAQGAAQRISEISLQEDEQDEGSLVPEAGEDLVFHGVSFAYETGAEVLNHTSFIAKGGSETAVVGMNGAGKTTIFSLIERLYHPSEGSITYDGKEIGAYDLTKWRRSIGYVSQNAELMSGTVRDNIEYGVGRIVSEEERINACKLACAYDFIMELENGFDSEVGERGSKLSGGQRQRIVIARELLKDPKILLLDEATSNLDPEAADTVRKAFKNLKKGRTTLTITHDLKAAKEADQILCIGKGGAADMGTHEELLEKSAVYRKLTAAGGEADE